MKQILLRFLFSILLFAFTTGQGFCQVPVTTANFVYLQDFNSFNGMSIATVPQWMIGGSFTYRGLGNGSSNSGGAWAYGIGSERALGFLGSNTSTNISYSISFVNNTGSTITQLEISYDFEQWRFESGNTVGWTVFGTGSLSSTSLAGLNSNSVNVGVNGTVQITPKSIILTGLNLLPNAAFGVQWSSGNGAGNDNGIAIDNFRLALVCAPNIVSADTTLCAGASFVLNGNTYTTNQVVSDTLLAANGCDSIVNYNLNFLPAITHSFADTTCNGSIYNWGSQTLTATGVYNQTFTSVTNCDSIVTLNLLVSPVITNAFADTICAGSTYSWGSQTLIVTGAYNQTFTSVTNCDSIVTLNLLVSPVITNAFADTICAGSTYSWGSQTLTVTGAYNQTFTSVTNCDSIVTLNLLVSPVITNAFADTICAGTTYNWGSQSFTSSGAYNQAFPSSANCDSTVTLNLFVRPAITNVIADTICAATTYNWGSQTLTSSGVYNQTFTSSTNCDSTVTLNLFVRPSITNVIADTICTGTTYNWGSQTLTATGSYNQTFTSATNCDSIVTLNLLVNPVITNTFADTICAGSTYTWGSQTLTVTGAYNQTFTSVTNCDSIVTLNLLVSPVITNAFADTICAGSTYTWGSQTLTATGSYNQTFTSATNCDSIVTLSLLVNPVLTNAFADTICAGTTYNWGSQTLTATGAYNQTFTSSSNCDSIVTLSLFVRPAIANVVADTICAAATYNWGSQSLSTSGSYNQTFTSATNCDSVVTLDLFIRPAITYTFIDTTCAATTYNWGSQNLTASGVYNQTFSSSTNCDSIVTLNLFVRPANNTTDTQSICSGTSYTFGAQLLTTSGVYLETFQNIYGCDSMVTLTLNVSAVITNTIATSICAGSTYNWGSQILTATGAYNQTFTSANNCDSIVTLNLLVSSVITNTFADTICAGSTYNWGSQTLTMTGAYNQTFTSATNCDSVVTLNLLVNPVITNTFADTICTGSTYSWGSQSLTATGSYNQTFTSAASCDSIVTLNLFVSSVITNAFADTICAGSTYNWGSQTLTMTGAYNQTFTSATNCDSVVTLNLLVTPVITNTFADTICAGSTYNWGSLSLTTSGVYNQTFTSSASCDSIVTLNLLVSPVITNTFADTICAGATYNWGSQTLTMTGAYNQTFTSANNCDSIVTLNLLVNPAITNTFADTICAGATYNWGSQTLSTTGSYNQTFTSTTNCDSIVTLNLLVSPVITNAFADTICAGSTYNWGSQTLTTTGSYNQTFTSTTNCDSIVTLNLLVSPILTNTFADTICAGSTYNWGSQTLATTGAYNQTFTSSANCDSIVTLNLFVRPTNNTTDTQSICAGTSYTFGTQLLTTSGVYLETFQNIYGCDSTVTLTLNVGSVITNTIAASICAGSVYNWGGQTITATGSYSQTFTSASSCDSIVTLNLLVSPIITNTFADTICAGSTYNWGSQTLTATGAYNQTFTSATNCDSVVTLNLLVSPVITNTFADTICAGSTYNWGSQSLTTSGVYNQTFTSSASCDSIVTLNLLVSPVITNTFADTICAGSTYNWGSQSLTTSGVYNQTFTSSASCDSIVTLNLLVSPVITNTFADTICTGSTYNWGSQNLTATGSYNQTFTSAASCDSIVTLNLFVSPAITNAFADTICAGTTYNWGSQTLTATGAYNQTFTSSANCDSIVTLNLFVRPVNNTTDNQSICSGTSYTFGTQLLTTSGVYSETFQNIYSCDSTVTLTLNVGAVITNTIAASICAGSTYNWGSQNLTTTGAYNQTFTSATNCDSVVTLNLLVSPVITNTFADTICAATTYNWGTQNLTTTGIYNQTFTSATGCDSVVTLNLFVHPATTYAFADTICSGSTYNWGTQNLTTTGVYNQTFTSATGCDSVVTLNLFVHPAITYAFADTICSATSYNWGSQNLTATGLYNQTFTSFTNCDSVVTLNLFVHPAITYAFADTICAATTYNWGSQNLTMTGIYNQTFTSFTNCDSIVTLNLFVRPSNNTTNSQSICAGTSYTFGSQVLTVSGVYSEVFQDINSCDSNVALTLNVSPAITNTIAVTLCYGAVYTWGTQVLNASGVYTQTFTASSSCDSVVTLNFTVNPLLTDTLNEALCFGQTFTLGSQVLNTSGTYSEVFPAANGCDSLVVLHLIVHPLQSDTVAASICYGGTYTLGSQNLSLSGNYSETFVSATGCDSIVTLNLQVSPQPVAVTIDTASCGTVWFEGTSYTSSAILTDTFSTTLGCDSIYRVVNINPHPNNPIVQVIDTASCGPLVFEGNLYTESITLADTIFNQFGCDSIVRTINISINNSETQTIVHEMCAGSSFTFNGQQHTAAGSYPFTFENQAGCDSLIILELRVNSLPDIEIIKDNRSSYCVGDSIILQASGAQFYSWIYADVDTLEGEYYSTILFSYKNAFSVAGVDINGCSNTASIHIDAQACCNIWMPNAFSPNADGRNDIFKPEAQGHPKEYVMSIYNRWGQTVYTTFNITQGWDGNINGKPADIADYYYRISGKCINGEAINLKGVCTLIR